MKQERGQSLHQYTQFMRSIRMSGYVGFIRTGICFIIIGGKIERVSTVEGS